VAGSISDGQGGWDFLVVRYLSDGTLDDGFGTSGSITHNVLTQDRSRGVAIQADGGIVVVGTSTAGSADKVIMRFTSEGDLDPTFNGTGVRVIDDSFASDQLNAVAIQPDQKIVVAGQGFNGSKNMFYIARLNADGTFDASFSGGEIEHTITGDNCKANAVAIMNDGRIVSAGTSFTDVTTGYDAAVACYHADGALDSSFDGDGIAVVPWSNDFDDGLAVAVQADNKVLVGGAEAEVTPATRIAITRLLDTGTPDASFGLNGTVRTYTGLMPTACDALALDADGNILVAGTAAPTDVESLSYLCRLLPADGSLDPAFGISGELMHGVPDLQESTPCIAVQPDGKVVLAGSVGLNASFDMRVIRYLASPITGISEIASAVQVMSADAHGATIELGGEEAIFYDVVDAAGRCVVRGRSDPARQGTQRITFPRALRAGGYVLTLFQGSTRYTGRFVVVE
jgi:uncharacterized delta-60 repeat protein